MQETMLSRADAHDEPTASAATHRAERRHAPGAQAIDAMDAAARVQHMQRHPHRPVSEIMSTRVITFTASTTIEVATQVMLARAISGAPVVDDRGRPIGIVSKTDLLEAWQEHGKSDDARPHTVVGDIMVPYLLAAQNNSPIALAAALMAYEGVHRLLVLDERSAMVGIVTSLDILRWLGNLSGFLLTDPGPL